ncbi:response regulator transcription factor [Phycicoccus sp. MAQZ13P-2]|uniref:response regulator n=1 Tax=Phycicoccus mangrovi TaxID=2840470 RepID=UPI001C000E8A|nr:response regulator transcription factor [Phycicoccus mangrovi]MBT9257917.1 response regulator transcription factor [Phycicoccus mangrovi]MBT9276391.1 response regulator transcription factor [Phycicoccus mangrovi]
MTDAYPPAARPLRVLIVEPHPLVREQLRALLAAEPGLVLVGECTGAEAARRSVDGLAPDVVVVAVRLPDGSGLDLCRDLTRRPRAPRVLLTSAFDDAALRRSAREAGASGMVATPRATRILVRTIREVTAGPDGPDLPGHPS